MRIAPYSPAWFTRTMRATVRASRAGSADAVVCDIRDLCVVSYAAKVASSQPDSDCPVVASLFWLLPGRLSLGHGWWPFQRDTCAGNSGRKPRAVERLHPCEYEPRAERGRALDDEHASEGSRVGHEHRRIQ